MLLKRWCLLIFDPEIIQILLELILRRKAGVGQVSLLPVPFVQPAIVEHLHVVADDKGHGVVSQALLEQNQPAHTAVPVLKRMDALEAHMEIEKFLEVLFLYRVVVGQQLFHGRGDLFGRRGLSAADFVGHPLVIAHGEPV